MIQFDVDGAEVLVAGTGSLSIEALSRGAKQVMAVENNRKSLAVIRKNIQSFEIGRELDVVPLDVFRFLKKKTQNYLILFSSIRHLPRSWRTRLWGPSLNLSCLNRGARFYRGDKA